MNTEQKVTSLELSRKLKEAGVRQESEQRWYDSGDCAYLDSEDSGGLVGEIGEPWTYAAFDCAELLEMLPVWTLLQSQHGNYRAELDAHNVDEVENTPAEALGRLLLWCIQEGHCDG